MSTHRTTSGATPWWAGSMVRCGHACTSITCQLRHQATPPHLVGHAGPQARQGARHRRQLSRRHRAAGAPPSRWRWGGHGGVPSGPGRIRRGWPRPGWGLGQKWGRGRGRWRPQQQALQAGQVGTGPRRRWPPPQACQGGGTRGQLGAAAVWSVGGGGRGGAETARSQQQQGRVVYGCGWEGRDGGKPKQLRAQGQHSGCTSPLDNRFPVLSSLPCHHCTVGHRT